MTTAGKRKFVRSLCNSVRDTLIAAVDKLPEDWNGIELRDLLAEAFEAQRFVDGVRPTDRCRTRSRRRVVHIIAARHRLI